MVEDNVVILARAALAWRTTDEIARAPELDPEEAGRIRDALASVGHAVLPPGATVECIVPLTPRTFRARTALGLVRAM